MMKGLGSLMKQAQEMQAKMETVQKELESLEVEGMSGGGLVKVKATAKGVMKNVTVDPSLCNADEKEMLEDLLVAAFNDAKAKGEELAREKMESVTGGLNLPGGMKLPF